MYLKGLEIQGFKSFADKVEFEFPAGVAIVVGPNGSGKSNVSDAIRWVLGEQSIKSLRGGKLEDIIFAGTDKRKPVGMAQVSITFDNSGGIFPLEYNEVTVTRRVYRSGESEFLINKSSCRLKDIHELFMDTGLGKDAYSIISQGKVEEIIMAKPEERRHLIEEAAGITKYRIRKQEATRRLTDTEQNLTRVADIICELESQIEPLRIQSEKAQEYIGYSNTLRGLELGIIVTVIEESRTKLTEYKAELENLKQDIVKNETLVAQTEAQNTQYKLDLQQKNEVLYQSQQAVFEVATSLERQEANVRLNEEKKSSLEQKLEALAKEIASAKERLSNLKNEEKTNTAGLKGLIENIKNEKGQLSLKEENLRALDEKFQNRRKAEEENKTELIELLNETANIKNSLSKREFEQTNIERKLEQNHNDQVKMEQLLEANIEDISAFETKTKDTEQQIMAKAQEFESVAKDKVQTRNNLDETERNLRELQNTYNKITSRVKALSDLKEDFEGYQRGVKEVLKNWKKGLPSLKGIKGVVAEVIKVPKELELAIEVALGGSLQHVITDTDESAKKAINFLKDMKYGRATFLPLNTINPYGIKDQERNLLTMDGVLGLAANLVEFPKEFSPVIEYLLGRIIIVENIDKALTVAKKSGFKLKIVTPEGEVLNPGGSLTGGSVYRKDAGLLSRGREIEELTKEASGKSKEITSALGQQETLKALIAKLEILLSELKEQGQNLRFEKASLEKDLARLVALAENLELQLEELILNRRSFLEDLEAITKETDSLELNLKACLEREQEIKRKLSFDQQELSEEEVQKTGLSEAITELKVQLSALEQKKISAENSIRQQQESIRELAQQISEKEAELEGVFTSQIDIRHGLDEYRFEIKNLFELKEKSEQEVTACRDVINELSQHIEEREVVVKKTLKELQQHQQREKSLEIKEARQETELNNSLARLETDFELTIEEALKEKTEIIDKREVNREIKDLKQKVSFLGNVNLDAIEEYTKVRERYEFLSQQCSDLNQAKESLYKVIKEMDTIMIKRFKEAFDAINEHFKGIFSELFAGGIAYLELTDEKSLLETGIEIIAQPPGKKPQNLNLLSGGEKALTAIGLLFALLRVRPSPFCVLDEIEASLDEANIDRFAEFLKEFSKGSQFIVISHRKGTMAVADVLYGITIDEAGVSKMVSLSLHS